MKIEHYHYCSQSTFPVYLSDAGPPVDGDSQDGEQTEPDGDQQVVEAGGGEGLGLGPAHAALVTPVQSTAGAGARAGAAYGDADQGAGEPREGEDQEPHQGEEPRQAQVQLVPDISPAEAVAVSAEQPREVHNVHESHVGAFKTSSFEGVCFLEILRFLY